MKENKFQAALIQKLKVLFPGCEILKNDSSYLEGVPDLIILFQNKWAMLEVKRHSSAYRSSAQEYYVELFDNMSFASFIYPENEKEVLDDLQLAFGA